MAVSQTAPEHLTAYERAVCYYTIPRVTSPLTGGLIIAYGIVLAEAAGLLLYGLMTDRENLTWWGGALTIGAVVFGLFVFFVRSLQNAVRERRAMAQAALVPDSDEAVRGVPDPFSGHVLLRFRPARGRAELTIEDNEGNVRYRARPSAGWGYTIESAEGAAVAEVRAHRTRRSFLFDFSGRPGKVTVERDGVELARAQRRFTLMDPASDIFVSEPEEVHLVTRGGAIYRNGRLVGRIYTVRRFTYLDVESKSFSEGLLGYFVAMG